MLNKKISLDDATLRVMKKVQALTPKRHDESRPTSEEE
jgi:hypothetical protein